jgi:hypothetical protein
MRSGEEQGWRDSGFSFISPSRLLESFNELRQEQGTKIRRLRRQHGEDRRLGQEAGPENRHGRLLDGSRIDEKGSEAGAQASLSDRAPSRERAAGATSSMNGHPIIIAASAAGLIPAAGSAISDVSGSGFPRASVGIHRSGHTNADPGGTRTPRAGESLSVRCSGSIAGERSDAHRASEDYAVDAACGTSRTAKWRLKH